MGGVFRLVERDVWPGEENDGDDVDIGKVDELLNPSPISPTQHEYM